MSWGEIIGHGLYRRNCGVIISTIVRVCAVCITKRRYKHHKDAYKVAKKNAGKGNDAMRHMYRCPFCRGYHLTTAREEGITK